MNKILVLITFSILGLLIVLITEFFYFNDKKLHVIFCNVGQGDAIIVHTPGNHFFLVDGGPDASVVDCLARHMPFWKRTIDLVLLTHPHADHLNGLISVLGQYHLNSFVTEKLANKTLGFQQLFGTLTKQALPVHYLFAGNSFYIDTVTFHIIGPSKDFLLTTSPNGTIGESKEFGSLLTAISYGSFNALLTGDSQADELHDSLTREQFSRISILQVPHHGSLTGLDKEILQSLHPDLAVISVGKNNRYHHPNPFTLSLLHEFGIRIFRTDQVGDVEIVSDGRGFRIN